MARQGKMHSCPFHIETIGYIDRVEGRDSFQQPDRIIKKFTKYEPPNEITNHIASSILESSKRCREKITMNLWSSYYLPISEYPIGFQEAFNNLSKKMFDWYQEGQSNKCTDANTVLTIFSEVFRFYCLDRLDLLHIGEIRQIKSLRNRFVYFRKDRLEKEEFYLKQTNMEIFQLESEIASYKQTKHRQDTKRKIAQLQQSKQRKEHYKEKVQRKLESEEFKRARKLLEDYVAINILACEIVISMVNNKIIDTNEQESWKHKISKLIRTRRINPKIYTIEQILKVANDF